MTLHDVMKVYDGSDGKATMALYSQLEQIGPVGEIAVNLFRAQKSSARAKVYRGGIRGQGSYSSMAYDRKGWAMENLSKILQKHGEACGIRWGWGIDEKAPMHRAVLYVDLPTGQVSFHAACRGAGPDYPGKWDEVLNASTGRICSWVAQLLQQKVSAV